MDGKKIIKDILLKNKNKKGYTPIEILCDILEYTNDINFFSNTLNFYNKYYKNIKQNQYINLNIQNMVYIIKDRACTYFFVDWCSAWVIHYVE